MLRLIAISIVVVGAVALGYPIAAVVTHGFDPTLWPPVAMTPSQWFQSFVATYGMHNAGARPKYLFESLSAQAACLPGVLKTCINMQLLGWFFQFGREMVDKVNRREVVKSVTVVVGVVTALALPAKWTKPIVESIIVPAHAATSACTTTAAPTAPGGASTPGTTTPAPC